MLLAIDDKPSSPPPSSCLQIKLKRQQKTEVIGYRTPAFTELYPDSSGDLIHRHGIADICGGKSHEDDENLSLKPAGSGVMPMVNATPNTSASLFVMGAARTDWMASI